MDYLNRLSKTDVESICKLIGSRDLKQNFQTNSNGFSRMNRRWIFIERIILG